MTADKRPVNVGFLVALAVMFAGLAIIIAGVVMRSDRLSAPGRCDPGGYFNLDCPPADLTVSFALIIAGAIVTVVAVWATIRSAT